MGLVNILTIGFVILMLVFYAIFIQNAKASVTMGVKKQINWLNLGILLMAGLLVRYVLACIDHGYEVDMNCFSYWSDQVFNDGFANFYTSGSFADYPPGYMYILWVVGAIRHFVPSLASSTILVKMPAMICDLVTAGLIYKLAHKRFDEKGSIFFAACYLFNPVILIDSAMWGQVDSVFTVFIVWMIYLCAEKKLIPAYFVFVVSVLIKPQALILTPVLGIALLDQLFLYEEKKWKSVIAKAGIVCAVALCILLGFSISGQMNVLKGFVDLATPKYTWLLIPFVGFAILYFIFIDFKQDSVKMKNFFESYKKNSSKTNFSQFLKVDAFRVIFHMVFVYLAIGAIVLAAVPYGLNAVWEKYQSTLTSYPYATVNGYNFWAMLGMNWHSQDETLLGIKFSTWGTVFIVLLCIVLLVLCFMNCRKKNGGRYFFYGVFIVAGFFTLSVRVHERYMFPVFALLLIAFLYKPRKEFLFAYLGLGLCQVNNIWHAFKFYDPSNFDWEATFPRIIGALHLVMFGYIVYIAVKEYIVGAMVSEEEEQMKENPEIVPNLNKENKEPGYWRIRASEKKVKFTKFDWIAMICITVIYGIIALYNLGYRYAPESSYTVQGAGEAVVFDFSNKQGNITELNYYLGRYENREFYIKQSTDGVNWTDVVTDGQDAATLGTEASKFSMSSVFCWGTTSFTITEPYVQLVSKTDNNIINELVFKDESGNMITPVNKDSYSALFDEQDYYPEQSTFRDSTYFDEIYHARTAYEMTQDGVYCYENTHPPLGKFIISIGIRIFGMCPFGWRIMGTLFGIAMLPIFYLFTKKFFKETWIATITTVLFAADFMHFTQTRIATIDVFVTFFIILMYYFMYQYTTMSFYDTSLKKTFVPLLCCGVSMGLGCACKWPGVYAGIGLAVVFFAVIGQRYMEYRYACRTINQTTEGIKHSHIKETFSKNTIKTLAFCVLAFVVIPVVLYTMSYIPFDDGNKIGLVNFVTDTQVVDGEGNTTSNVPLEDGEILTLDTRYTKLAIKSELKDPESFTGKIAIKWNTSSLNRLLGRMIRSQDTMFSYHSKLEATHPFSSWSYEWPIMKRPIWYYNKTISGNIQENISAFGNPLVWWAGIPAFIYMLYLICTKRDKTSMFLTVAYMAQFLPWTNVSRITFIYHYFPSVPFITIMIGYTMYRICQGRKGQALKISRGACIGYAVAAVALFALFYPVISGYPADATFAVKYLRWLSSWTLVSG